MFARAPAAILNSSAFDLATTAISQANTRYRARHERYSIRKGTNVNGLSSYLSVTSNAKPPIQTCPKTAKITPITEARLDTIRARMKGVGTANVHAHRRAPADGCVPWQLRARPGAAC